MILYFFIIPLNVILLLMMAFLLFAFLKERSDESSIKNQMGNIKKTYDDKTAGYDAAIKDSQSKMEEAIAKAQTADEESKKVAEESELKVNTMKQTMDQKMEEIQHLEESIKAEAQERMKKFEQEQKEEVEKNMVNLVMNVTQEVFKKTLSYEDHKNLIKKSIEEMKLQD